MVGPSLFFVLFFFFYYFFVFFFCPLLLLLLCTPLLCGDFVFLLRTRYGRPVCCRKKAGLSPCLSSSSPSPSSYTLERRTNERTNDQRNVNRKPREATLINPTEINCAAQRRSLAFSPALFSSPCLSDGRALPSAASERISKRFRITPSPLCLDSENKNFR